MSDSHRNQAQGSELEPVVRVEPLGAEEVEGNYPKRSVVRITSIRNRLLDPDNLVGGCKYIIDALTKENGDLRSEVMRADDRVRSVQRDAVATHETLRNQIDDLKTKLSAAEVSGE